MASLVVQTSFIGDVVLTTPLISALAASGPVDVVTTSVGAAVLSGNPHVRHLLVYDKRGRDRGLAGFLRVARHIRAEDRDSVAYLAQGSLRSALLTRTAGYRERIGFDTSAGRRLYTRCIRYRRDRHHAERLLRLAFGDDAAITASALRPSVYPSDAERAAADAALGDLRNEKPFVALAPGSVWATKRWPYYGQLVAALPSSVRVVIVGSADDAPLAAEIVRATRGDAIDATGKLSLLGSAELIRRCRAIVTNDSAPLHLASAMNTPTVAVFGPTVPAFGFGPLADTSASAEHRALDCRPCHPHGPKVCPLGHWRCMRDLTVDDVLARLAPLL